MSAETNNSVHNNDKAKGGPVSTEKSAERDYATTEEICEAVERLTEAERGRIYRAAQYAILGTEYTDPLELLGEAVQRTLEGVGVKRWAALAQGCALRRLPHQDHAIHSGRIQQFHLTVPDCAS